MAPVAIEADTLTHYYNDHPAVDRVSFSVDRGTIFGLLGPNGAGKSTTVKMLTTLLPITSGRATIMGCDVQTQANLVRQSIGYVPQLISADGDLTAYENLLLSARLYGLKGDQRRLKIEQVLRFLGLLEVADTLVNKFSGGMIRRLEIAQALLHDPKVLFLDEPTSGLDPAARKMLWQYLLSWRSSFHSTIFLTTQDMQEAEILCDIICFMHQGQIVKQGSPRELKEAIGPETSLDEAFIHYTGSSIAETGDFTHARQIRRVLSRRR